MNDEDLELLITLDDPEGAPEEDIFHHLQSNNLEYWLGQQSPPWCPPNQRAVSDNDA